MLCLKPRLDAVDDFDVDDVEDDDDIRPFAKLFSLDGLCVDLKYNNNKLNGLSPGTSRMTGIGY
jgi:hypothetical protein